MPGAPVVYSAIASQEVAEARQLGMAKRTANQAAIASCLQRESEFRQKCIADASEAVPLNRHLARAYLTRGLAYGNQADPDKALADFNAAIREDPRMAKAYYNRGVLLKQHAPLGCVPSRTSTRRANLQPNSAKVDQRLYADLQTKRRSDLDGQVLRVMARKGEQSKGPARGGLGCPVEFVVKPDGAGNGTPSGLRRWSLSTRPSMDLEKKLDATAEK